MLSALDEVATIYRGRGRPDAKIRVSLGFSSIASGRVFVSLVLLFMAILAIGSLRSESLTIDELVHIPSGLSYWQKRDTRLNVEHPPLLKMISAVPLLFAHVNVNYSDPAWCGEGNLKCEWEFGKKFVSEWNANPQHIVFLARVPMVLITLLLGVVIYAMARSVGGLWGGALSLVLFASSPFYLGLGTLVVTDIGLPLFVLSAAWTFGSLWSRPNYRNLMWFSAAFACALLSKFSAVLLLPTFFILWIYFRFFPPDGQVPTYERFSSRRFSSSNSERRNVSVEWYALGGMITAAALVLLFYALACGSTDANYMFGERAPTYGMVNSAAVVATHASWFLPNHPLVAKLLNPVWLYMSGVLDVGAKLDRTTYLLGRARANGVWFYFPVVAFFKLTPGMIGCCLLMSALFVFHTFGKRRTRIRIVPFEYRRQTEALIGTLVIFAASAIASPLNLGIRHLSVPISITLILCSLVVPLIKAVTPRGLARRLGILACGAFAISGAGTALLAYPHYISYYNLFRLGMPKQEIANGSNLDWGQSLIDLERFREQHHVSYMYVDSRTIYEPALYVSGAVRWRCNEPEPPAPAWIAVSANYVVQDASLKDEQNCKGLLHYPHRYISDGSMLIVNVVDSSKR